MEDLQSAYIMSEKIKDDYSFEKPCPPTAQRVATYDAATKSTTRRRRMLHDALTRAGSNSNE